jgi:hypothetical protein
VITKFQSLHQGHKVRVGIDYGKVFAESRAQVDLVCSMEGTFVRYSHKMEFLVAWEQKTTIDGGHFLWCLKFVAA